MPQATSRITTFLSFYVLFTLSSLATGQGRWSNKGFIKNNSTLYTHDRNLAPDDYVNSGDLEIESSYTLRANHFFFRPRVHVDYLRPQENRFEPLEAYWEFSGENFELRVGQVIESWAVTDTFNPVDILNRRDLAAGPLESKKLGELMLRWKYFLADTDISENTSFALYVLPVHRTILLPSSYSRWTPNLSQAVTAPWQIKLEPNRPILPSNDLQKTSWATRLASVFYGVDAFLFYYLGPTRYPVYSFDRVENGVQIFTRPVYYRVSMTGAGFQWAQWGFVFKGETAFTSTYAPAVSNKFRSDIPNDYLQYVAGFDYSFSNLWLNHTTTFTLEYSGESQLENETAGDFRPFKSDFFLALHYNLNDLKSTAILLTAAVDRSSFESIATAQFERKLTEGIKVLASYTLIHAVNKQSVLYGFPNNTHYKLSLAYYF